MVKTSSAVHATVAKILSQFSELGHIKQEDIQFAWRISKRSPYHGKTRLIRGEDRMFTEKKVVMTLFLKSWKQHDKAWRALLLYHELRHIAPGKEDGEYRTYRHNIEDFMDIAAEYGVRWEHANRFLTKLEKEDK
jgi:hypothetical protein